MDDEYEDIVEESLVLVEFAGNTGDDALNQDNNVSMKILGVESEQPIIQMGKQLYRGEYQDTLGTELFFREVEGDHTSDSLFDTKLDTKLVYCGKANKKIVVHRAFVEAREENAESLPNEQDNEEPMPSPSS